MTDTCRGIDVSSHQGDQDWSVHKENGVVFAFAKASEGQRSRDGQFSTHIRGIRESGLVPGAYHFGWPNQPVEAEVSNYVAAVRPYSGSGFVHWLDLERYPDGRNYSGVSDVQIRSWAEQWVSLVGKAFPDQRVGAYSSGTDIGRGRVPEDVPLCMQRRRRQSSRLCQVVVRCSGSSPPTPLQDRILTSISAICPLQP